MLRRPTSLLRRSSECSQLVPGKAYRRDIVRTLRMVYSSASRIGSSPRTPRRQSPRPSRSEASASCRCRWPRSIGSPRSAGRWGPLVVFMADTGARPAEALAVEWRHVDLDRATVELPGVKTDLAWRTVHMTSRGVAALRHLPRSLTTRRVFHVDGRPVSFDYFRPRSGTRPSSRRDWIDARRTASGTATHSTASKPVSRSQPWRDRWVTRTSPGRFRCTAVGCGRWERTPQRSENRGLLAPGRTRPPNRRNHTAMKYPQRDSNPCCRLERAEA